MAYKAFLVGANTKQLEYSKSDAKNLGKILEGYSYETTISESIDNTSMNGDFINFISNCHQTDTLIIYFSGHGIIKQGKLYFLLTDDEKSEFKSTYNINNLLDEISNAQAQNKLVILDCCSALVSIMDWKPDPSDHYLVLTASDRIEKARELDGIKSSFLTYKISQYLSDKSNKEEVSVTSMYEWIVEETKNYNKSNSKSIPIPNLIGNYKSSFLLGKNSGKDIMATKQLEIILSNAHSRYINYPPPAISNLSINPKSLDQVFVEPILSKDSENKSKIVPYQKEINPSKLLETKKKTAITSLSEIISSEENILFIGKKESGKTALLHYLQTVYLISTHITTPRIPIFIDFSNLLPGKNRLEKTLIYHAQNLEINVPDIMTHLVAGNFILLIDNFEVENKNKKVISDVNEFFEKYNKNRFVLAANENLLLEIEHKEKIFLSIDYSYYYIHSFQRKQIKELVDKWFSNESENAAEITKSVIKSLDTLRLPNTPLTISLLLIAFEHQQTENYVPVNKSSLIQMILELLLEKMDLSATGIGEFDYRLKEALLSYIAFSIDKKENYKLETDEFLKVVEEFFNSIGREIPRNIKSFADVNFIKRGILMESDGNIFFRFGCFAEYFIAQYMIDEPTYYQEVINGGRRILNYHQEIDYLTGKTRNNKEIITKINNIVDDTLLKLTDSGFIPNDEENRILSAIANPKTIKIEEQKIEGQNEEEDPREKIRKKRLTGEMKEDVLEIIQQPIPRSDDDLIDLEHKLPDDPKSEFATGAITLAIAIRNSELIKDNKFKRDYLRKCVNAFWNLFLLANKDFETIIDNLNGESPEDREYLEILTELIDKKEIKELTEPNNIESIKSIIKPAIKNFTLSIISEILFETAGTPSLKIILQDEINDKSNKPSFRILYALLYADLGLEGFLNYLEQILSDLPSNSFLWRFLIDKVFYYYIFCNLNSTQIQKAENILAEMIVHRKTINHKMGKYKSSHKSSVINDLHRTRNNILSSHEKD